MDLVDFRNVSLGLLLQLGEQSPDSIVVLPLFSVLLLSIEVGAVAEQLHLKLLFLSRELLDLRFEFIKGYTVLYLLVVYQLLVATLLLLQLLLGYLVLIL